MSESRRTLEDIHLNPICFPNAGGSLLPANVPSAHPTNEDQMKSSTTYRCEKCGFMSADADEILLHEPACLPLEIGQTVKFEFNLVTETGRVTGLQPPKTIGQQATVDLETDSEITDVDMLHDGKHVWVERNCVTEILK